MRLILTLFLALGLSSPMLFAQVAPDFWGRITPEQVVLTGTAERQFEPLKYTAFTLDFQQMALYLTGAPEELTAKADKKSFLVMLPLANGQKETFAVVKTHAIDAALEVLHPEIGLYAGEAMHIPGMQVRITVTPGWGFNAMITRADKGIEYVEPVAIRQNQYYMAYDRVDLAPDPIAAQIPTCKEIHQVNAHGNLGEALQRFSTGEAEPAEGEKLLGGPVSLKLYRFACSTTGEFSQDNGGTKDLVFQKITMVTNQLNAIFERDINIRLMLIAESYDAIFLDPTTDPFLNNTVDGWMNQNPAVLSQFVGPANLYDIGHVFARYITGDAIGIASLGSVCTGNKARGCSAGPGTYGDYFLGIAAHEMGHQWSAGHTFNQCNPGDGFSTESACEPGGGNTILGYNSCGSNNTTGGRDLYYHACTMAQIRQFVEVGSGSTCGTSLSTTNNAPVVTTPYPALMYIPISTPFELIGTGTDPDGNDLVYSWDEVDLGPSSPLGSPSGDSPLFRWLLPTPNPTRTFPRIQSIIANTSSVLEVLPTYSRNLTFSFVARDNQLGGGGVSSGMVKIKSTATAGPFLVSYPNEANITWQVGEYRTVLWDVANTFNTPVNAKTVNIKLSTDDGLTYPLTIAAGVPNTGKHCIQVPDNIGSNMRIRVEAADNVFFDISNATFSIVQPTPSMSLCTPVGSDLACLPADYSLEVTTVGLAGFSDPITLSATGLPSGAVATFSPNPVQPGSSAIMTLSFPDNSPEITFDVTVVGNAGASSSSSITTLTIINNDFSAFGPTSPANGAAGVNQQPPLYWTTVPDGDKYDVEVATNPSFEASVLVASKQNVVVDSFQLPVILDEGKVYYWRVRPKNDCGLAAWSEIQVFVVAEQNCTFKAATDLPKSITANGTPTIESKITMTSGGVISDVNVKAIQGNHTFFRDLEVRLISPSGTNVLLWKDKCGGNNGSFNVGMDDGATGPFSCPPPNTGVAFKPTAPLSTFNGEPVAGDWILRVKDNMISSGGNLTGFELEICSGEAVNPPIIVTNSPLTIVPGTNSVIGDNLLKAQDADNGPSELIFTLMSLPANGQLMVNGIFASTGVQFTQADISSGGLRYFDYNLNLGPDDFKFSLTDGQGGLATGTFVVQLPAVGTHEPKMMPAFDLAPNPASATAVLTLSQPLLSDARVVVINTAGQVVETLPLTSGAYALRIDLQHLPRGVYAVSVENEQLKSVKKLVIQ